MKSMNEILSLNKTSEYNCASDQKSKFTINAPDLESNNMSRGIIYDLPGTVRMIEP